MSGKRSNQQFFEVESNWLTANTTVLSASGNSWPLRVSLGNRESADWCPEQLLLGAVCAGFMTTFLEEADALDFSIAHLDCHCIGQVEEMDGGRRFTNINVYPRLFIATEDLREKALQALNSTLQIGLIQRSVLADVFFHPEIVLADFSNTRTQDLLP